jgi:hypothetical protein
MNDQLSSLNTADASAGLKLAVDLAEKLHLQIQSANKDIERPGGTNYLLPAPVPKEVIAAVLFYAIAAANKGWIQSL